MLCTLPLVTTRPSLSLLQLWSYSEWKWKMPTDCGHFNFATSSSCSTVSVHVEGTIRVPFFSLLFLLAAAKWSLTVNACIYIYIYIHIALQGFTMRYSVCYLWAPLYLSATIIRFAHESTNRGAPWWCSSEVSFPLNADGVYLKSVYLLKSLAVSRRYKSESRRIPPTSIDSFLPVLLGSDWWNFCVNSPMYAENAIEEKKQIADKTGCRNMCLF